MRSLFSLRRASWSVVFAALAISTAQAASPVNVSVNPPAGTNAGPLNFTYTFSDGDGATNMRQVQAVTSASGATAVNNCYFYVWAASPQPTVYLADDSGSGWAQNSGAQVGQPGASRENSSCILDLANSTASFSGSTFSLTLRITFKPTYAGNYTQWMWSDDQQGNSTPWDPKGSWTVPAAGNPTPQLTSLTPNTGSGLAATNFQFVITDPQGADNVKQIKMIASSPSVIFFQSCYAYVWVNAAVVYLADNTDNLVYPGSSGLLGSSGILQNSQCKINLASSSQIKSGNTVTVTLNVQFLSAYGSATPRTWYGWADDWNGNGSNFVAMGTWTIPVGGGGDTTAPVISQVSASPTSNGATITWYTNEPSDSQVDYGTSTLYGLTTTLNTTLVNSHAVSLTALAPATYYFRVRSRDAAGNLAMQAAGPFPISTPNFTLTLTPANQETVQGSGTAHTVILNAQGGFTGSVNLTAPTVPPGTLATFSSQSLLPGQSATLTLRTANGTPIGQHPYVISGTSGTQSAVSVSGTVRVTAKTAPLVVNSENAVHQPNTGNIWEPSSAVGNAWVTAWNILTDNASAVVDARVRAWDGAWTNETILISPYGRPLGDLYLEWDAGRKRYIFCAIDIQPGGLFPPPTNVWYGFSNEAVTEWTIASAPVLSGSEGDWDFPSCGVDTSGRIGVGAVNKADLKFNVKVSAPAGTFSTPPTAIPTTVLGGQASKGALARLVAAGSEFHAFIPTLDLSYLPIEVNWHRGITTNPQNGVIDWSSTPQPLYEFNPPLNHSPTDHCKAFPNDCKRIYYAGAHLDAHGTPGGHWAVVFSEGMKVGDTIRYNNAYLCTSSRGCGRVNQSVNDQFLAGVAVVDQPGTGLPVFWVSYLTYSFYNPQTHTGTIPLISQAVYFLPGQSGVGATTRTGIQPTYWLAHPGKCNIATGCYAAGDYVGISANPFLAASTPIIDKHLLRNGISQLFVQDPESPVRGQTFSIPWAAIPFGTVSRSATILGPHISPGVNPALRRGPMTEKPRPRP